MNNYRPNIILLLTIISLSCAKTKDSETIIGSTSNFDQALEYVATVQQTYVPDPRLALFKVEIEEADTLTLTGETNLPQAKTALLERFKTAEILIKDQIDLLPNDALGNRIYAIVKNSVGNLRAQPKHSSELVTQALLGMELKLYKKENGWFLVQTPDQYFGWINEGEMQVMDSQQFTEWQQAPKVLFTKTYGFAYQQPELNSNPISDLVAGSLLQFGMDEGMFEKVLYPDGRVGHVLKDQVVPYDSWLDRLAASEQSLVDTALNLRGLPYLWGGTSTKGIDCSGFTKTVFFLNGLIIPRDASQQVRIGSLVDSLKDFSQLKAGDLLFFGAKATDSTSEKVVHVGLWVGDDQFIHSSDRVRMGSVNPDRENYDEFNLQRYLKTKRVLGSAEVVPLKKPVVL